MNSKAAIHTLVILVAFAACPLATADEADGNDLTELKNLVLDLKKQMLEMQKTHKAEIDALKNEIQELRDSKDTVEEPPAEEEEAAALRALAENLAGEKEEPETDPEETVFKSGDLSLQKLNPEISVSGDFVAQYRHQDETRKRTAAEIRGLELNFQSYLDPFSRLKATTHIHDSEIDVEEAYFTRFSVMENANLDLGKFRQQFGIVNRWHEDALDQVQYPLALRRILGDEGLSQTGASLEWTLPKWGDAYQGLVFQVTNTDNEHLFGGDERGKTFSLFPYGNFRDLSRDTYLEFGLSGLFGWNDQWSVMRGGSLTNVHDTLGTQVFGADMSYLWEPVDEALYKGVEWRSEVFVLNRDILAPDDSGRDGVDAWGAYSYVQTKTSRSTTVGIRGDYFRPDSKSYANVTGAPLNPFAYTSKSPERWQVCPYLTWWQSEFVKFRWEYDYAWGKGMEKPEHVLWFQANFAAGPHKHERY